MLKKINKFFEEVRKESLPQIEKINSYWDKKTIFVHRRALIIGFVLGILFRLSFGL